MPFSEGSYDPETLALMTNTLQEALRELELGGATKVGDARQDFLKTTMALRIMSAVRAGERDPTRLKLLALNAIEGRDMK
jgi:hypothetical protein